MCTPGVLPITLMLVDGGLRVIFSASIVLFLLSMLIDVVMNMSLLRTLKADVPQ